MRACRLKKQSKALTAIIGGFKYMLNKFVNLCEVELLRKMGQMGLYLTEYQRHILCCSFFVGNTCISASVLGTKVQYIHADSKNVLIGYLIRSTDKNSRFFARLYI